MTGGCGFIGAHLVRRLVAEGSAVTVIDDLRSGGAAALAGLDGVELVETTLGRDADGSLDAQLAGADCVFHLAAVKHNTWTGPAVPMLDANVDGTYVLLEAAARAGVRRLVFASSLYANGRRHAPALLEDEPAVPDTVYGATKLTGERMLAAMSAASDLETVALRYFFVYGPSAGSEGAYKSVINLTLDRLGRGEPPLVHNDGNQQLDYIHVDDAIEATMRAAEAPEAAGNVLNVCSGRGWRVRDLISVIVDQVAPGTEPQDGPADATAGTCRIGDPAKTREILGFEAAMPFEQGIAGMAEAALARSAG